MTFADKSPIDGAPLDPVEATKAEAVAEIVGKARAAQVEWASRAPADRTRAIAKVKNRILERADDIAKTVRLETGKPEVEALLAEVLASADVVDHWTTTIEELLEPIEVELDRLAYPAKTGFIHRVPRGTLGVIMPWNYPFALPLRSIVPALLAGNAVVFKPSEITPRSGALIANLFKDIVPEGVLSIVQGGGDVGTALCEAVDFVIFTGSAKTGRKVAHACAERLIPCALELGGKDAAIVLSDANLDRAANGVVWGALTNAGQNCAAIERVYVEKKIADAFCAKVTEVVKQLREGEDYGPLTTEAQRSIVRDHVAGAREAGAKVLVGGEATEKGYGFAPTVLRIDGEDTALMTEETFGPVIPIRAVDDVEEAIKRANESKYGLTASIWTKNVSKAELLAHRLRAGVVTINNHSFTGALPQAPWSGVGESGYGITGSMFSLEAMTRPCFVLIDRNRAKRELFWYPYTPSLADVARAFAKLRGGAPFFARIGAFFALLVALPKRLLGK